MSVSILIGTLSPAGGGGGGGEAAGDPAEEVGGSAAVDAASAVSSGAGSGVAPGAAGGVPRTRARLVVPSFSIATSRASPANASREISRDMGLNPARIPSAEKLSHFRK